MVLKLCHGDRLLKDETTSFTNPTLQEIGKEYGKSVAQVALRYLIQRDIIVIPKSTHKERMIEEFQCFRFFVNTGRYGGYRCA